MLAHFLRGQLHAVMLGIGASPAESRGLDPDFTVSKGDKRVFAGQIEPNLTASGLICVLKAKLIVAREWEIFAYLPQCNRISGSTHNKAVELFSRLSVFRQEVIDLRHRSCHLKI